MNLQVKTNISILLLFIVDLCLSAQNFAEQINNDITHLNSNNKISDKNNINIKSIIDSQFGYNHLNNNNNYHNNNNKIGDMKMDEKTIEKNVMNGNLMDVHQENFLMADYLSDGEIERRMRFNGITAKETRIINNA